MLAYKSDFIFSLANESGIDLSDPASMTDKSLEAFLAKYSGLAKDRDEAVARHIQANPSFFRTFIPHSDRSYRIAAQLAWYFDELIVFDPILVEYKFTDRPFPERKARLAQTLGVLSRFKDSIYDGFLLPTSIASNSTSELRDELLRHLIKVPDIVKCLRQSLKCGHVPTFDNDSGGRVEVFEFSLDSGGVLVANFDSVPAKGGSVSFRLPMGRGLAPLSIADAEKALNRDLFGDNGLESLFLMEAERSLRATERALQLNSAVLFDRDLDAMFLEHSTVELSERKQQANVGLLNLILPYVQNTPAERLMDLRRQTPNAFMDFRGRLWEIVANAMKDEMDIQELKEKIQREIASQINSLESELNAEVRKQNIIGIGMPLVAGLGVLTGTALGAPPVALLSLGAIGAGAALNSAAEKQKAQSKAKGNPFYFLWKAANENQKR